MFRSRVGPLVVLVVAFALVELFDTLVAGYVSGWGRTVAVVALAVPAWLILARLVPGGDDDPD